MPITKVQGKKDGLQKYRVRVNYTTPLGEYKQLEKMAYGLENAKILESTLLKDIKTSSSNIKISELYDEYINAKKHVVREATLDKTIKILESYVLPHFRNVKLTKLSVPLIQNWKNKINETSLTLRSRQNIYSTFNAMMNFSIKMGYLTNNPLKIAGNFQDAYATKRKINYYTIDEFKLFINEVKKEAINSNSIISWNYYLFFNIAFFTGLRKGEIHALKWSDIDNDYLTVSRSITQKVKGDDRETPPKNSSSIRTLQIPVPLKEILNDHYDRCKFITGFNDEYRVCGGIKPLRDSSIDKKNIYFAKTASVKAIRIHDFRHSHASLLANEGINIQEIARRLGHSKIEMTWNTYSHLYPREEERAVAILNKISI